MKFYLYLFGSVGIISLFSFMLLSNLHSAKSPIDSNEKKEYLEKLLGRPIKEKGENIDYSLVRYKGKFLNFSYPVFLLVKKASPTSEGILEGFFATSTTVKITVALQALNTNDLDSVSGLTIRKSQPEIYKEFTPKAKNVLGIGYIREENQPEVTGFFKIGDRIISLSVSGIDIDEARKYFNQIASSLE